MPNQKNLFRNNFNRLTKRLAQLKDELPGHPFHEDAATAMAIIKNGDGGDGAQLALTFMTLAVLELLNKRGCATKVCMVAAMALVDTALRGATVDLFQRMFAPHRKPDETTTGIPAEIQAIMEALAADEDMFKSLPDGVNEIEINGQKHKIMKFATKPKAKAKVNVKAKKTAKTDPFSQPPNRWN